MEYLLYSDQEILERVDEYSLYCSYLGYQPLIGGKYQSPIRSSIEGSTQDTNPSFGIFERKYGKGAHEFKWKDQSLGKHGDIFDLVQILCKLQTKREALLQVLVDADLAPGERSHVVINVAERKTLGYADIQIESKAYGSKELSFWGRLNVGPQLLQRYDVRAIKMYWLYSEQAYPRFPKGIGFAYPIFDKYQLYFPWETKRAKFRTDWTDICVPGFRQLQYDQPLLIITKSMKDVLCLRSFGYEAISVRGENMLLPPECIACMKRKYRKILVLFDNDGKHKGDEYEFEKVFVPKIMETDKDTSDFIYNHGRQAAAEMLRTIFGV